MLKQIIVLCAPLLCCFEIAYAQTPAQPLRADGGFASTPVKSCKSDLHYFNQVSGWQTAWPSQWDTLVNAEDSELEQAIEYWAAAPYALQDTQNALEHGIEAGRAAPRAVVVRVIQQAQGLANALNERDRRYFFPDASSADAKRWNAQLTDVITPAVEQFTSFLEGVYLPAASETPGLAGVKDGAECFANAAAWWTTLSLSPEEIEKTGTRLLSLTREKLSVTGEEGQDFEAVMSHLRAKQLEGRTTAEELFAISDAAVSRANDRIQDMFFYTTGAQIVIEEMPQHMQASFPAGFYRPPQGGQSAAYVLNPSRPQERRLMAEVIAFHEAVPGHHLFYAYPRENPSTGFNAGMVEGWAIYAEYLADELGLYSSTFDRQGMMAKHLWAASRLVVEPGLHFRGWTRDQAIDFMLENTVLSRAEIEIEVDRYLALPGQSLSYMLGADLIMRERRCAQDALGEAFDIKTFHDVILFPGVRPLPELRRDIHEWVKSQAPWDDSQQISHCFEALNRF